MMKAFRYIDHDGEEYEVGALREDSALPYIQKRLGEVVPKETVDAEKLKRLVAGIEIDVQRNITPDEANTMVNTIKTYIIQEIDKAEKYYLGKGAKKG